MGVLIQILLSVVILTLTFFVGIAGYQVFHILHEFRHALKKLNKVLDNTRTLSENAARPVTAVNEFFSEVKTLVSETQDEIIAATPDRVISTTEHRIPNAEHPTRRFFRRAGLTLRSS